MIYRIFPAQRPKNGQIVFMSDNFVRYFAKYKKCKDAFFFLKKM